MSFDEEHLDEHYLCQREVAERDARIRELEGQLAECRNRRQREHDARVTLAGELESFKIRYQDEVNARVNAEDELNTLRAAFVAELRKAKDLLRRVEKRCDEHIRKEIRFYLAYGIGSTQDRKGEPP